MTHSQRSILDAEIEAALPCLDFCDPVDEAIDGGHHPDCPAHYRKAVVAIMDRRVRRAEEALATAHQVFAAEITSLQTIINGLRAGLDKLRGWH